MKKIIILILILILFCLPLNVIYADDIVTITSDDIILNEPEFTSFIKQKMPFLLKKLKNLASDRDALHLNVDFEDFEQFWNSVDNYYLLLEDLSNNIREYEEEVKQIRKQIFSEKCLESTDSIKFILRYKIIKKNIDHAKRSIETLNNDFALIFGMLKEKPFEIKIKEVKDLRTYVAVMASALYGLANKNISSSEFEKIGKSSFAHVNKIKNADHLQNQFIKIGLEVAGDGTLFKKIQKYFLWNIEFVGKIYNYELYVLENKKVTIAKIFKIIISIAVLLLIHYYFKKLLYDKFRTEKDRRYIIQMLVKYGVYLTIILIFLTGIGLDLSKITLLISALSIGIGFGLQKVFSNLVSGLILLLDKSITPGDTIEIGNIYGKVTSMNARFASILTRDGKEYLIPNENLLTDQVINWTHSNTHVRLKIPVGISYQSDAPKIMQLIEEVAVKVPRVLSEPKPKCRLCEYGDSSVNLEIRVWIGDPENGIDNVITEVLLAVWNLFKEHNIEFPYPQQDVHLKSLPVGLSLLDRGR